MEGKCLGWRSQARIQPNQSSRGTDKNWGKSGGKVRQHPWIKILNQPPLPLQLLYCEQLHHTTLKGGRHNIIKDSYTKTHQQTHTKTHYSPEKREKNREKQTPESSKAPTLTTQSWHFSIYCLRWKILEHEPPIPMIKFWCPTTMHATQLPKDKRLKNATHIIICAMQHRDPANKDIRF